MVVERRDFSGLSLRFSLNPLKVIQIERTWTQIREPGQIILEIRKQETGLKTPEELAQNPTELRAYRVNFRLIRLSENLDTINVHRPTHVFLDINEAAYSPEALTYSGEEINDPRHPWAVEIRYRKE